MMHNLNFKNYLPHGSGRDNITKNIMSEVKVMPKPPKLRPPIPEGEYDIAQFSESTIPNRYAHVLYVIHPSKIDGDSAHVAKADIQSHVDKEPPTSRVVLIAPPDGYVYLRPNTKVTDIRTSADESSWVDSADIPDNVDQMFQYTV